MFERELATAHLNAMNAAGAALPWPLSFSLWPRAAGAGAKSLEKPACERAGGTKSAFSPREMQQCGVLWPL